MQKDRDPETVFMRGSRKAGYPGREVGTQDMTGRESKPWLLLRPDFPTEGTQSPGGDPLGESVCGGVRPRKCSRRASLGPHLGYVGLDLNLALRQLLWSH